MSTISKQAALASLLGILSSVPAGAIVPATAEQLLCSTSEVFIGQIFTGDVFIDCRVQFPNASSCSPKDILLFSAKVIDVLGSKSGGKRFVAGDTIEFTVNAYNEIGFGPGDKQGWLKVSPAIGQLLTKQQLDHQFLGKRFFFGIVEPESSPLQARSWPLSVETWVLDSLHNGSNCPKPMPAENRGLPPN